MYFIMVLWNFSKLKMLTKYWANDYWLKGYLSKHITITTQQVIYGEIIFFEISNEVSSCMGPMLSAQSRLNHYYFSWCSSRYCRSLPCYSVVELIVYICTSYKFSFYALKYHLVQSSSLVRMRRMNRSTGRFTRSTKIWWESNLSPRVRAINIK